MMKINKRRLPPAAIQALEKRCLLSAAVLSQIPTQNLTDGQIAAPITLNTYLSDPSITGGTVIEMATPLGNMFLQLTDSQTPLTVANFVQYINDGEYVPTIIQRSVPGFVIQGGGTKPDGSNNEPVSTLASEAGISNTTGTIAMALNSNGPGSATNQWFINLADNTELDGTGDGGPFTVFGNVIDGTMSVANAIANLPIIDGSAENQQWYIAPGDGLPVVNYTGSDSPSSVPPANLVTDTISVVPSDQAAPTYTVISNNPSLVTASVTDGMLTVTPASDTASGSTTVTATVTDVAGETASSTFTVNVARAPINLAFLHAPGNVKAGNTMTTPIKVSVTDASGNPIAGVKVKLTIASGPSGASVGGTFRAASNSTGVANFSGANFTKAGSYTLEAVDGSATSAPSASFTVRAAAATQLAFAQPPTQAAVGEAITPAIVVDVEDQFGNVVTTDDSKVKLVIKPGTGPDDALLGGTLSILADDGVATFSDITLNEVGSYKLKAKDGLLTAVKSALFDVLVGG